jgi:hypothetical protein
MLYKEFDMVPVPFRIVNWKTYRNVPYNEENVTVLYISTEPHGQILLLSIYCNIVLKMCGFFFQHIGTSK